MACMCCTSQALHENDRLIYRRFLLARLHVDSLQDKRTKSDVWSALDTLSNPSQTLEKTYEDATKRLRSQLPGDVALATKVITWIVYAQRQLTTTELGHALAVKPLETSLDDDGLYDIEEVVSLCAGLVVIDEGTNVIRLVHYTTQQYFEEIRESWNPQGQLELARTCLTYLSYAEFRQDRTPSHELIDTRLKAYPFLKYAAFYWSDHAMTVQLEVFDLAYSLLLDNALITNFARVVRDWQFFGLEDGQSYYTGTALHVLASLGLLYMAKEVHARFRSDFDAWVNKENDLGYTCLFCAVYREDEPMVRLLLDKGADVNVLYGPMGDRSPLLWLAIAMKNLEIVQLMIDRGADLHLVNHDEEIDDEISAILVAASVGHIGIIQLLFDNGADLSIVSSRKRYTAIYLAASRGYLDVVRFLLDKGVDADSPDNEGCTAMHIAAMYGNASIVGILLDRGATASLLDDEGRAAIHVAVENGQSNIVQLLWARGADPDLPTGDGKNAVSLAAQSGQYKLVELLLEKNADPNMILSDGWTAIHVAAQLGHSKTVQLLLNKGVDPNVASQGTTAITLGSSRGHIEVVQLLLKGGADPNVTNDETAIFKATESGHLEVVQLLLEGGADPNLPTVDGRLPIHAAADGGYLKIVQILLDKGVDFDAVDKECGRTAVYAAARHGHVEIVRLLLEKGANLNLPTSNGWTPLHRAAGCGHLSIVELLMHRGADVLATTHSRATPLTEAAWNGHAEVVDVLIRSCPDWRDIITPDGSVPAIVAKRGHVTILKHLHEKYVLDLQAPDNQSRHLVHIAARYGQSAIISFLVDKGISALTEDAKGDNILCYAASSGSLETVNKALELMPEPWTTDEGFWSPLHWACKAGNKEVVERLIEAGLQSTKVTLAQPEGEWSPIDVAMLHGHVDLLQGITDTFRSALGPPTTVKPQLVQNIRGQGGLICDGCEFASTIFTRF
jgi:ankyrin repeat protein